MAPLLSVVNIVVNSIVASWEGGELVTLKSYKHNGAPSLSLRLLSIVTLGGEALGDAKILQKIMAPLLSVISIVKVLWRRGRGRNWWR